MNEYNSLYHFSTLLSDQEQFCSEMRLFQIGELVCQSGNIVPEHTQFCDEISYCTDGKAIFYIDSIPYPVSKGDVFVCRKGGKHTIVSDTIEPIRYFFLGFELLPTHFLHDALQNLFINLNKMNERNIKDKYNLADYFNKCLAEFLNPTEFSHKLIENIINQLIIYTIRLYNGQDIKYQHTIKKSDTLLFNIKNYIDDNILEIQSLKSLEDVFQYSYSHLSHYFSKKYGSSLNNYIKNKQLEASAKILIETKLSITEISEKLGYSSIHPFSKAFKNKYNVSPSEYKKMI